jgi:hypothetical protein
MDKSLQALAVKATQLDREVQVVMSFWDGWVETPEGGVALRHLKEELHHIRECLWELSYLPSLEHAERLLYRAEQRLELTCPGRYSGIVNLSVVRGVLKELLLRIDDLSMVL